MVRCRYYFLIFIISALFGLGGCQKSEPVVNQEKIAVGEEDADLQEVAGNRALEQKEVSEETQEEDDVKEDSDKDVDGNQTTPVKKHGKLTLEGTQIVDKNGDAFQIKGVSTHGLMWFPQYVNKDTFTTIRDEWNANCIRLAMYTGEGGYCSGSSKENMKELVCNGVDYATELGMYVIIDWHILKDNDPNIYIKESMDFFKYMSEKYSDNENVIYEICNEPNSGTDWSSIKSYALQVIPVIRENDPEAIIVVGTPNWSQDVDIAANDPITEYDNIMYTIHFYADTHRENLRNKMMLAYNKGLPVFCSEFGICDASGNGAVNIEQADEWISLLDDRGISYCIWNLSNKNETSSLIHYTCSKLSDWEETDLSDEGNWYLKVLGGKAGTVNSQDEEAGKEKADDETSKPVSSQEGNLTIKAEEDNSWNDGNSDFRQLRITLTNNGDDISQWNVSYTLDGDYVIDQSWGGEFSIDGKTMNIKNVDYNGTIKSGESISDIGVIIRTK